MDKIDAKEFKDIDTSEPIIVKKGYAPDSIPILTKEEMKDIIKQVEQPVDLMKELAAKLKFYIDKRIEIEMVKGVLTDYTLKWVSEYNRLLERVQKALYGDKSVSLHLHKVSHADISKQIRAYSDDLNFNKSFDVIGEKVKESNSEETTEVEQSIDGVKIEKNVSKKSNEVKK